MSCNPTYTYRPAQFTASNESCRMPVFHEHRARLTAGGTFFRTVQQSKSQNLTALELTSTQLNVYYDNVLREQFNATSGAGSIAALRALVNNTSTIIEMPMVLTDIFDSRTVENDGVGGGLTPFTLTRMSGGDGGPTDGLGIEAIRTGPERTLVMIATTEDINGRPILKRFDQRMQQWNGVNWLPYDNAIPGRCSTT